MDKIEPVEETWILSPVGIDVVHRGGLKQSDVFEMKDSTKTYLEILV